jgi:hypothetical protein
VAPDPKTAARGPSYFRRRRNFGGTRLENRRNRYQLLSAADKFWWHRARKPLKIIQISAEKTTGNNVNFVEKTHRK